MEHIWIRQRLFINFRKSEAMRYYLLQTPEFFTDGIDIIDFHKKVGFRSFYDDRLYELPSRSILYTVHKEYGFYPDIVLDPMPLFSSNAWAAIQAFMGKIYHVHFILMDKETRIHKNYYCPCFGRINGRTEFFNGKPGAVTIYLKEPLPKDIQAVYLREGDRISVIAALDLLESLMRRGLCDMKLIPATIVEE